MIQSLNGVEPRIHPTAWVHPMAVVIGDVELAENVNIWPGAVLRGDCGPIRIGANSNIQDGTVVHTTEDYSATIVGERVTVGHAAVLHGCRIADDCLIGMNATVLDNVQIGSFTIVAAGAVVTVGKVFEGNVLLVGSPARVARALEDKHRDQIETGWRNYVRYMQPHRDGGVKTIG